jgi:hypothetical protein
MFCRNHFQGATNVSNDQFQVCRSNLSMGQFNYIHDMHTLHPTRKPGGAHTIDLHH